MTTEIAAAAADTTDSRNVGVASIEQIEGLSGLEMLQRLISGALPRPPIGATLNFDPEAVEHGRAVFAGTPLVDHYNPIGTVHGGWIAAMLDSALGCAVHSTLAAGSAYTTVEIKVNYLRAVTAQTGRMRAEGKVIHVGRSFATAEATLTDAAGKLYAHATTTCAIFPLARRAAAAARAAAD
ncbi:PaaI family thioesterase [Tistrella sp. BH-R2-4]|jgi:uncharacterized protein (TIGR00369 family)|uniref:PaaI family thioesterase n=1 Tax=Tistrella arctica TaxID=3133430 RepID=A0ABU9YKQ5_9PROT